MKLKMEWGATFDTEVLNLHPDFGVLLCAVIKPIGGEPEIYRIEDYGGMSSDDSRLVEAVIDRLNQFAFLIAHNGVRFDRKYLNSRALKWGLTPLGKKKNIYDPLKIAWQHMNLAFNNLGHLAKFLGCKYEKTDMNGEMWLKACIDHDTVSMDYIVEHCVMDVLVLEEVALKVLPLSGTFNEHGSA